MLYATYKPHRWQGSCHHPGSCFRITSLSPLSFFFLIEGHGTPVCHCCFLQSKTTNNCCVHGMAMSSGQVLLSRDDELRLASVGGFLKWGYPQSSYLMLIFLSKPSILGYPHLRNPPVDPLLLFWYWSLHGISRQAPATNHILGPTGCCWTRGLLPCMSTTGHTTKTSCGTVEPPKSGLVRCFSGLDMAGIWAQMFVTRCIPNGPIGYNDPTVGESWGLYAAASNAAPKPSRIFWDEGGAGWPCDVGCQVRFETFHGRSWVLVLDQVGLAWLGTIV